MTDVPSPSSYWLNSENDALWKSFQSPEDDNSLGREYDVIIIGGGISGVSTAYHLAKYGLRCAILEKDGIASGATGHNGGIIKTAISSFKDYSMKYGHETALALLKYSTHCIDEIISIVNTLGINCELRFNGSLTAATTPSELRELFERYSLLIENNFSVEWWTSDLCQLNTKRSDFLGGIFWPAGGNLWAAKLVFGLASQTLQDGSSIHCQTTAISVQQSAESNDHPHRSPSPSPSGSSYQVLTNRGTFLCSHVVYACNAWCRALLPSLQETLIPVRNQVIITSPVPRLWSFSISTNDGYEYMMQRPDGRIVLGMPLLFCSLLAPH
jgi:gamma-glutamylputrescine oxidase